MTVIDVRSAVGPDEERVRPEHRAHVLLVEDDDADAKLISRFLLRNSPGRTVFRTRTLGEALAATSAEAPDIIVADLGLPDASGVHAAEVLVGRIPGVPLIVLTGSDDNDLADAALAAGAEDYLRKDRMSEELLNRSLRYALTRHATQRRLAATRAALQQTDGDLDDFAHVIAHDLRSPLRTSRLLADRLVAAANSSDPTVIDLADRLDGTLARLDDIVLTMLEYASLRCRPAEKERVPLLDLVRKAAQALDNDLDACEAVLDLRIERDAEIHVPEALFTRVLDNLLTNAIKYRSEAGLHLVVEHLELDGGAARIRVCDNGLGIPAADRERVFQVMERLHPSIPGTGFGLSISRRIVEGLGGTIGVEVSDRPGTTIVIDLPGETADDRIKRTG